MQARIRIKRGLRFLSAGRDDQILHESRDTSTPWRGDRFYGSSRTLQRRHLYVIGHFAPSAGVSSRQVSYALWHSDETGASAGHATRMFAVCWDLLRLLAARPPTDFLDDVKQAATLEEAELSA